MGIEIKHSYTWMHSRNRLLYYLGKYATTTNPKIILNFNKDFTDETDAIVLNKKIEIMSDKIKMNKRLDKLEIPHPKTWYFPKKVPKTPEECVVKKRSGGCGYGIQFTTFLEVRRDRLKNRYVQSFVPFEREYRVIVDFLGVVGMKEKIGDAKCKNSKTCKFKFIENERLGTFAVEVARKFGVDFTGMDIGEWNNEYYVIELNSCPSLCSEFAEIFANHLIGLLWR